jgi:tRNA pseudouridine38/39 synthase
MTTTTTPPPDYTTWTPTELIARISTLESQLRAHHATIHHHHQQPQQQQPSPTARASAPARTKKPKRIPKPPKRAFDPTRYHFRPIALKFAYLGQHYNGFEHHANNTTPLPTIEEELWRALVKVKLIGPSRGEGTGAGEEGELEVCWDGVEYSKCGRTDRGVSAFGQVVGLRVRSARPVEREGGEEDGGVGGVEHEEGEEEGMEEMENQKRKKKEFDPIRDELPYIQLLNRVLPPDIRVLAWCPDLPEGFSARFNCKERRYRYFFTNPAFTPLPGVSRVDEDGRPGEGWLDVEKMQEAARKYEGLHDFRNFCKVDASKQISSFERRIFHAGIHEVQASENGADASPRLYYFDVRGSAFLWHQVRHLVAVLFLVGQGFEQPSVVDDLLDIQKTPARPHYDMASDVPLVLWDCIFPSPEQVAGTDHGHDVGSCVTGYTDDLNWIHVGDEFGGRDPGRRSVTGVEDGKYGRNGIMDELWALWRKRKMDEVLAWSMMGVVNKQGHQAESSRSAWPPGFKERSARIFDGGAAPRAMGIYTPLSQRERMELPEVVNARYAARKGIYRKVVAEVDMEE